MELEIIAGWGWGRRARSQVRTRDGDGILFRDYIGVLLL